MSRSGLQQRASSGVYRVSANRQVIAVMRGRLAAGEPVARMFQEPGLAWLERQAEATEQLLAERQADGHRA
jgi:hypothetical protein